jgi:hypothetical protein
MLGLFGGYTTPRIGRPGLCGTRHDARRRRGSPVRAWYAEPAMAEHATRQLLKAFGIAVTNLEDAVEDGAADAARKADAELRERMKEIIELVETLSERAAAL